MDGIWKELMKKMKLIKLEISLNQINQWGGYNTKV